MGYHRAGFDVIGVDIEPQPRYPFEFVQADAMTFPLEGFDVIHASPPCQRYSTMTKKWGREDNHPDYIEELRLRLVEQFDDSGALYVIENVPGAPLYNAFTYCGSMFGLGSQGYQLRRHRLFESNVWMWPPTYCSHRRPTLGVYGHAGGSSKRDGLKFPGVDAWREGMGIDWMTGEELAEAIPPAYTEYIGKQLMAVIA